MLKPFPLPRTASEAQPGLRTLVATFEKSSVARSAIQIATSIGLYLAANGAMYWSLHLSYLLTLALTVPTAGLLVRVFIVQHDCGHGAFFRSRRANDVVGMLCSLLTFTPYANWRRQHNCHHGSWNNLDRRVSNTDIYSECITVEEYRALSRWGRLKCRLYRHPVVAQLIIPPLVFLFVYRIPFETPKSWVRERRGVYLTNIALLAVLGALVTVFGFWSVVLVQVPVIALTAIIGVLLFSIQHRFDGVVWARQGEWNLVTAAVQGSSYFKLPRVLQWFTGNIGFHHVHHLNPRVPNYRLEACHAAIPALHAVKTVTWRDAFKASRMMLWDEANRRMIRFADIRRTPYLRSVSA